MMKLLYEDRLMRDRVILAVLTIAVRQRMKPTFGRTMLLIVVVKVNDAGRDSERGSTCH